MDPAELWAQYGPTLALGLALVFIIKEWLAGRNARTGTVAGATTYVAPDRAANGDRPRPQRVNFGNAPEANSPAAANPARPPASADIIKISDVTLADSNGLRINNMVSTTKELLALRSRRVHFTYCGNSVGLTAKAGKMIQVTINGKKQQDVPAPVKLDLGRQAICLGEVCVMWPKFKSAAASSASGPAATTVKTIGGRVIRAKKAKVSANAADARSASASGKPDDADDSKAAGPSVNSAAVPKSPQTPSDKKAAVGPKMKAKSVSKKAAPAAEESGVSTRLSTSFMEHFGTEHIIPARSRDAVPVGEQFRGKIIGLYFSAHWCPPCRQFTPYLCDWLERFRGSHPMTDKLELVFVSRDRSDDDFRSYHGTMNFPAIPRSTDAGVIEGLMQRYGVSGIPALVFIDSNGDPITRDGRSVVSRDMDGAGFPWSSKSLDKLCGVYKVERPLGETNDSSKTAAAASKRRATAAPAAPPAGPETSVSHVPKSIAGRGTLDLPITRPFDTFDSVLEWKNRGDEHNVATVPRRPRVPNANAEKLMVCHDMMGGYNQDRCPQGSEDPHVFRLYHWHLIDSFIYFSHNLVSIPTPGWTNTAHKNGTKVLGTFITEWDEGSRVCGKIFMNKTIANSFATKLVGIAKYYGFDGYLVNIENPLSTDQVVVLKEFLKTLTTKMHAAIEGSMVVWYDAVTIEGSLIHQNGVNAANRPFFELCDAIFLNYFWTPQQLTRTVINAGKARAKNVYAGIDVFGRKTYGGGGFKSQVALAAIEKAGLSTALFAPGWIFEDAQFNKEEFDANYSKFWSQFEGKGLAPQPLAGLPLVTSFSSGTGTSFAVDGTVVTESGWSNLGMQTSQHMYEAIPKRNPYYPMLKKVPTDEDTFKLQPLARDYGNPYQSGNSLAVTGTVLATADAVKRSERAVYRLMATQLPLSNPACISFTFKVPSGSYPADVGMTLLCEGITPSSDVKYRYIQLRALQPGEEPLRGSADSAELGEKIFKKFKMRPSGTVAVNDDMLTLSESMDCAPFTEQSVNGGGSADWVTRSFVLGNKDFKNLVVKEIRLNIMLPVAAEGRQPVTVFLGELKVARALATAKTNYSVTGLRFSRARWSEADGTPCISGLLSWSTSGTEADLVDHYDLWTSDGAFVGRSLGCQFTIQKLPVPTLTKSVTLLVQPCSIAGLKPQRGTCSSVKLTF